MHMEYTMYVSTAISPDRLKKKNYRDDLEIAAPSSYDAGIQWNYLHGFESPMNR